MTEFEKLFTENKDFIFKYLLKLTDNPSIAEELTADTFFRAYMNFASLRNREKFSVWLCQIAKNTYFAWYNKQKKLDSFEETTCSVQTPDLEEMLHRKELSQKALVCLHDLEEPYKEVFMLATFGGYSLKQISQLFGKSESWARVTFHRARHKLLEKMR